jgi:hypothetical protein
MNKEIEIQTLCKEQKKASWRVAGDDQWAAPWEAYVGCSVGCPVGRDEG